MASQLVYILALMNMTYYYAEDPEFVNLYISGSEDTHVDISMPWDDPSLPATRHLLTINNYRHWNLSRLLDYEHGERQMAVTRGIKITADKPVSIQVSVGKVINTNTAAYTALPMSDDATRFHLSSLPNSPIGLKGANPLFIVGTLDLEATIQLFSPAGDQLLFSEVVHAGVTREFVFAEDLTGLLLVSDVPVSVFSGHQCGNIPANRYFCEAMLQQIPPVSQIGTEYIAGPVALRTITGYTVRTIFPQRDTTYEFFYSGMYDIINREARSKCSDHGLCQLFQAGEYIEVEVHDPSIPVYIKCSAPCYVFLFNHGGREDNTDNIRTDPFMALVPALDLVQKSKLLRFSTTKTYNLAEPKEYRNFVNIIVRTGKQVTLDGHLLSGAQRLQSWDVYMQEIAHDFHEITSATGEDLAMAAVVYGHGQSTDFNAMSAYAYPAQYPTKRENYTSAASTQFYKVWCMSVLSTSVLIIYIWPLCQ